jgi:RNA polymerase sigma-70 factor, ECF subfamily
MADITRLLARWAEGDGAAFEALIPIVYEELRRLAGHYLRDERARHTLQPTALVHEAYLRLANSREVRLGSRSHFYGAAARVMRRVLVDHARKRGRIKRGGPSLEMIAFDEAIDTPIDPRLDFLALDEALAALERVAPERALARDGIRGKHDCARQQSGDGGGRGHGPEIPHCRFSLPLWC